MKDLKLNVVDTKPCLVILDVEVPQAEVSSETEKVYQELQKTLSLPGFRTGKAPMEMIRKNYVENARAKVVQNLAEKAVFSALKTKGIEPVNYPKIHELSFDFDKPFKFKMEAEKHPEFKLKDYKGIKVNKIINKITDVKVNESLDVLRERNAKLCESKSEAVDAKHFVMVDYDGYVKDVAVPELKAKDQMIDLSSPQIIVGFKEGLSGAKKGEERSINVKFPADYPNKKLANEDVVFKVIVKEIKEKLLHPLDDEFAKDFGFTNLAELKQRIKENLEAEEKNRQEKSVRDQIIESLLKSNAFEVPKSFVEDQLEIIKNRLSQYYKQQGIKDELWKTNFEKNKDKYLKEAEEDVRLSYIFREVIKEFKIEVSQEELNKRLETMKESNKGREKEVEKYFSENKEKISASLKEEKIFDFLIENAKIKENVIK
ncbi:MAG: trigger factor [Elusimicrobia bacterium]|nr:trigger factor [Candidatus Liberimonas magnetica]